MGGWAVSQKRIFAKGFCLDFWNCSYCFQNQSQSCSPNLRQREPKDTILAALLWRPESVIPWFHERFVARCPIGQIWDRWWVYEVLLFGKTANMQSKSSWVVDCSITNMKENNFLFLHRTNLTISMPQCISLCSNKDSATSIAQGTKKKFLSEAQGWQQSEKQRLLRKFVTHKTKEKEQQQQLQLACPPRLNKQWVLYSPFLGQCCIKISQHILEDPSFCVHHTHKTIWVLSHRYFFFFGVSLCQYRMFPLSRDHCLKSYTRILG